MENLKISDKLFEDVIYYVLGSLDDEVNIETSRTVTQGLYVRARCCIIWHCVFLCVCVRACRIIVECVCVLLMQLYRPQGDFN